MKLFQKNHIMKILIYSLITAIFFGYGCGKKNNGIPGVVAGKIVRIENIKSKYISPKTADVWLPDGYNRSEKYAVIYMNDGQMLFDSTVTWNKQEWQVDEVLTSLLKNNSIKKCIVVGVFNNPDLRMAEYFPQVALDGLLEPARSSIIKSMLGGKPLSDDYLKFLVTELKPVIDSTYSTIKGPEGTFIMGSSMGGLISLYALCKYPDVFGGAACMSTHWIMVGPGLLYTPMVIRDVSTAFRGYLSGKLPELHDKKIYFDYGTGTLDSMYRPYQVKIDAMMALEGFNSKNWETKEFAGHVHDERSWAKRLSIPVEFLLGK
jgi:pimeloyl-ACP methyl ester carboxylesterase